MGSGGGSGGGGGQHTVSTEKADPWGPQQPYLMRGFQEAERQLNQNINQPAPFIWPTPQADETLVGNQLLMNYLFGAGAAKARDPIYDLRYTGAFNPVLPAIRGKFAERQVDPFNLYSPPR